MSFDNVKKDFNRDRPFHRVGSPVFDKNRQPVDGRGFNCGCRAPEDFPADSLVELIARAVIRAVPGWVPVPLKPGELVEKEIEGPLIRSFQTWTDNPLFQYHTWYDWNFYIEPIDGYKYVKGAGNHAPAASVLQGRKAVSTNLSMEGEWDCGAFSKTADPSRPNHGFMFNNPDFWWPQKDHYTWLSGRWIYDCGHSDPPDNKVSGLMRSEIHPVKAMATARWEAFKFDENQFAVPAIQFMFFASIFGGYKNFVPADGLPGIRDRNYEFIVDLPKIDAPNVKWAIGHTPETPFNTGVLRRPHLLKHKNFAVFDPATGTRNAISPEITEIPRADPTLPPEQVRVKFNMDQLPAGTQCYGVILTMGWFDPDLSEARKVKDVTVTLDHVQAGTVQHDRFEPGFRVPIITPILESIFTSEWQLRIGVNGRWIETPVINNVSPGDRLSNGIAGKQFHFLLDQQDAVRISAHGVEIDPVGDFIIDNTPAERTLMVNGAPARWEPHIVIPNNNPQQIHDTCVAIINRMAATANVQNEPLGLIDPGHRSPRDQTPNPLPVANNMTNQPFVLTAHLAEELGELAELAINEQVVDYTLHYKVTIKSQVP